MGKTSWRSYHRGSDHYTKRVKRANSWPVAQHHVTARCFIDRDHVSKRFTLHIRLPTRDNTCSTATGGVRSIRTSSAPLRSRSSRLAMPRPAAARRTVAVVGRRMASCRSRCYRSLSLSLSLSLMLTLVRSLSSPPHSTYRTGRS